MPPRATVEEFDDDTDLPLPTHLLPNTGARGALLEQIGVDYAAGRSDSDDDDAPPLIPAAASSTQSRAPGNMGMGGAPTQSRPGVVDVTDVTPFKKWTSVYPIYIDAKRPHGTTQRRIARTKAVWWPLSQDIADACRKLGLQILHEPQKMHPRDWENPGRVKVLLKKDGVHVHPIIRTKRQLIERIASTIQATKPELVPSASTDPAAKKHKASVPPTPLPPMSERVSQYSPALESGVLVEAVKASMNPPQDGSGAPAIPGGAGKGKKKVIRVRG
ncbi:signal recognition particle, SRP19 subunit [Exidia glandulosa HHB12029]|uniref:Signal recognition particle, SRP19 subunit n=1 Tax=Exidia glandulosa HHB12029 TaxID=1314781 RepID=A0A165KTQ2_EXIGL|nr:signal recognition particle, SRP19 subunit [Exidia glandulosa HHB12029]